MGCNEIIDAMKSLMFHQSNHLQSGCDNLLYLAKLQDPSFGEKAVAAMKVGDGCDAGDG